MDILNRSLAPIPQEAWDFIDEEAKEILSMRFAGRKIVDFEGPKGIDFGVVNTGRLTSIKGDDEVDYKKRAVLPLVEIKKPFRLKREEMEALARGAVDVDTDPLIEAAEDFAAAENDAILNGLEEANIKGIIEESEQPSLTFSEEKNNIISTISDGISNLYKEGVGGPYTLMLGPGLRSMIYRLDDQGYPLLDKIKNLIKGEVIIVPALKDQGLLVSSRGDDFELIVGQDASVGYSKQTEDEIEFFFLETFTFRINSPEAATVINKE